MEAALLGNPNSNPNPREEGKRKVVVVMGATGAGKSRLAIDLACYFSLEIINADSMQVYEGLDVLTNKVPFEDRKGVPHHLLGTISPNVDFTSKEFRDQAIPIVDEILSHNCLPVIVGGTNYYIQALVSPFLVDDLIDDVDECNRNDSLGDLHPNIGFDQGSEFSGFDRLKVLDPVAANRIHPNDHRKRWGQADNFRYDCCFVWVDASLTVLDRYVEQRVDSMMDAGLLAEVHDIYNPNAAYTRGLRQAIGVREFEEFLRYHHSNANRRHSYNDENRSGSNGEYGIPAIGLRAIMDSDDNNLKILLSESIDKLKANTRRLVRRQKRRLNRLKTFFGWDLHYIDATEAFLSKADDSWTTQVVEPCVNIIRSFLYEGASSVTDPDLLSNSNSQRRDLRDLWTQYVCEACGNRTLRGAHEWEQHKQGRGHRKRVLRLRKKSQSSCVVDQKHHPMASE
ncbi:tRNA dimethylallyltransferase 2 isoform X2 [Magnolia sinica]|uniref:tRNA dimethylallyltransferase 2 isoform X2 n=1 Tax=Magnolia sinica TaxID=86752 RepID=UPI00265AB39A|nr:tRNA dimethylallyltransferase 2 isoform X2 [Magnolia sinica]